MAGDGQQSLEDMMDSADARTLNAAGNAFADRGMWNEALECYERSRDRYQQTGDRRGEALVLNNLGAVHYAMGDWDAALAHYQQALAMLHSLGEREGELLALMNVCFLRYAQGGQPDQEMAQARRLAEELGQHDPLTKLCWMRGDAAFREGADLPRAFQEYALACLHASRAGGDLLQTTLTYIGEHLALLASQDQRLAALTFCDHLLAFGREHGLGADFLKRIEDRRRLLLNPPLL